MSAVGKSGNSVETLIVEDSPTQAEELKYFLESEGYSVTLARNGKEALSLLEKLRPTLVISDSVMSEMDGYELCRRIKENATLKEIPVLLLTLLSSPEDMARALQSGANHFISKPYDRKSLLYHIQHIVANQSLRCGRRIEPSLEVVIGGQKYSITSDRWQILDFLISAYEATLQKNEELLKAQEELKGLNEAIEPKVKGRTASLMAEITQRKHVEEALRQSESRFRLLAENAQDFIYHIQILPQFWVEYASPAVKAMTGYAPEDFYADPHLGYKIIHPDDRPSFVNIAESYTIHLSTPTTRRWLRKDGQVIWVESRNTLICNAAGEISAIDGVARDVTNTKRAEAELTASEGKYRTLMENAPVGIIVATPEGRMLEANRTVVELSGCKTKEEFLNISAVEFYLNPEDAKSLMELFQKQGVVKDFETRLKSKNGTVLWISIAVMPQTTESGEEYITVLQDITERKKAEEEIRQSYGRLQKAFEQTIQATALISEVRDPYTAGHQRRVAQLCTAIAGEMGLPNEQLESIRMAAFIHDIGKIHVPSEILSRPGKLTQIEFSLIKSHSEVGYDILKTIEFPWPIARIVLEHHERLNGSGYPSGLTGDKILLEAKIVTVADVVEAMSSHRPYRAALGLAQALEEIRKNSGTRYDHEVANACIRLFTEKGFQFEQ